MALQRKHLYYGVVSIRIGNHIYNEFGYGVCDSEGDFIGKLTHIAMKERPGGFIANVAAYLVDDATVLEAASHARGEGGR